MDEQKGILSKYLELDETEFDCLLGLQKLLTINDIAMTGAGKAGSKENADLKDQKLRWCKEWEESVASGLRTKGIGKTEREVLDALTGFPKPKQILILLEAHAFVPYFPLSERGSGLPKRMVFTEEARSQWAARLEAFVFQSNIEAKLLTDIRAAYEVAVKEIPGRDWKSIARNLTIIAGAAAVLGVTGGIAAPWVGGIIGSTFLGLSGAAATSAGLAFLGGGAIAAGGFGMAGGTIILAGGGAILGSMLGRKYASDEKSSDEMGGSELIAFDTNFVLTQAAKIETIARSAVEGDDKDDFVLAVLKDYRKNLRKLDAMLALGEKLKNSFPKLDQETLARNRRMMENAARRLLEIY